MGKIAVIALLYIIAAMPAFAADGNAYPESDAPSTLGNSKLGKIRANADRMGTFSLLELNGTFRCTASCPFPDSTPATRQE